MGRQHARMDDVLAAAGSQLRRAPDDPLGSAGVRPADGRAGADDMSDVTTPRERARPEMSGPVLGMVLFVAFFGGYFTIRANAPAWPPPDVPHLKIDIASILTVVLVASSVAVQLSLRATRDGRRRQAPWWLGATIGLGVVFLGLQLYDYSQLGFGLKDGVFGTLFYVMTGIHMAHVVGGVA